MKRVLVKDIMTERNKVVTISPYAKVKELLKVMKQTKIKSVVVERTSEHDAYGIVTYTSILKAIFAQDGDMDLVNVYDIMAKPVIQISQDLEIRYAAKMMINHNITRVLVMGGYEMVGIISMNDIVAMLMEEAEKEISG